MAKDRLLLANKRQFIRTGLAACAGAVLPSKWAQAASSEELPQGPVRLIVPHTAGTTPDVAARLLAPRLAASFNRAFVVDNRAGASGLIGIDAVSKAVPDGATLMLTAASLMTLPLLYPNLTIDVLNGFTPISLVCSTNFALVVNSSMPVDNFNQFLAYVKARPGEVHYASPGKGTFHHLWMEQVSLMAGLQMSHVPYKGTAQAATDVLGGVVKTMFLPVHVAIPLQKDGRLRILGVISSSRDPSFPQIPTLSEGGLPGFSGEAWYALLGPKGLKPALTNAYHDQVASILAGAEMRASLIKQGINVRGGTPENLYEVMKSEREKWVRIAKEGKLNLHTE